MQGILYNLFSNLGTRDYRLKKKKAFLVTGKGHTWDAKSE